MSVVGIIAFTVLAFHGIVTSVRMDLTLAHFEHASVRLVLFDGLVPDVWSEGGKGVVFLSRGMLRHTRKKESSKRVTPPHRHARRVRCLAYIKHGAAVLEQPFTSLLFRNLLRLSPPSAPALLQTHVPSPIGSQMQVHLGAGSVSYTHLTLPTILLV